jgi:uncharacterized protein YkwD
MKRKLFSSFFLFTLVCLVSCIPGAAQTRSESEVFALVNKERARTRMSALAWDDRLADLARNYSRQMAREGFFGHRDRRGRSVMERAHAARIQNWSRIGENLFVCDRHPYFEATAIQGWLKSPGHRKNMLNRGWTATGIGVATARDGSIFITQVFTRE